MKTSLFYLVAIILFLSPFNKINAQETEKGGVIKLSLKTTPEILIETVAFFDENGNNAVDENENCYFLLKVKNTGKTPVNNTLVETKITEGKNIFNFNKKTHANQINPGKTILIKIPVTGNDIAGIGSAVFSFTVSDAGKYKSKTKQIKQEYNINIKKNTLLASEWYYPVDKFTTVNEANAKIRVCIKTEQPLSEVRINVNNAVKYTIDNFEPISDGMCNYMISKEIELRKGENNIKLIIKNKDKTVTTEKRIINYEPKITEYRNALVIGNSHYKFSPLKNPVNDAKAMAQELRDLNFNVIELIDADKTTMRNAVRKFKDKMREDRGVGLFYYAGHGVQLKGENYLIPINCDIQEEYDIPDEALRVNTILAYMQDAGTRMNIVILDACRNNPFAGSMRSASRGLASIYAEGSGTLIAYATAPGSTAMDGDGKNGLYTQELLKAMKTPGLEIGMIFRKVLGNVQRLSGGSQIPWTNSSITGEFYFKK